MSIQRNTLRQQVLTTVRFRRKETKHSKTVNKYNHFDTYVHVCDHKYAITYIQTQIAQDDWNT